MKRFTQSLVLALTVLNLCLNASAQVRVTQDYNGDGTSEFKFKTIPQPSQSDAATKAVFTLISGRQDGNGNSLMALHDGVLPTEADQPAENFFLGSNQGRIVVDLGKDVTIKQINTYSWHPGSRGPQVYSLYASQGKVADFDGTPASATDPGTCGWIKVTKVDTRPAQGQGGGQYGASISDASGVIGTYRYLMFDISNTRQDDVFSKTFFSEIDVVDTTSPVIVATSRIKAIAKDGQEVVKAGDNEQYTIIIDTADAPDLTEWAHKELAPVVKAWYPKLVTMLPSEGYEAPATFSIVFSSTMQGVAATGGTRISCAASWFRPQLQGEAIGAIVHEMVHVVQQYGRARRTSDNVTRTPGWLVEGLTDYIRWYLYEPYSQGAEITQARLPRARYDGSYRVTANFIDYVIRTYDKDLIKTLNATAREGRYTEDFWKTRTGLSLEELDKGWKLYLQEKIDTLAKLNTLTPEEEATGWQLLFDGSLSGWHNFKRDTIRPGWQALNGALVCVDPHNAGDLCTDGQFDWFELNLEYSISEGGNSGIMYHVTNEGGAAWATGPEFQLEDNEKAADKVRCGWLYALYQPPIDPKTGKTLDATLPVPEWNHVRLIISPDHCEHIINGVSYFKYVLGSDDFNQRVKNSKFGRMSGFAKSGIGYVTLQGDHGQVSFRNIKIRPIKVEK